MNIHREHKSVASHAFYSICAVWIGIGLLTIPATLQKKADNGTPYRVEEFSVSSPVQLTVHTSGGNVEVSSKSGNKVRVEMYVRRNGRDLSKSDTDLKDFDITIEQHGNNITASARRRDNLSFFGHNNISISFVVYTPEKTSSDLNTSGGNIRLQGLQGETDAHTSGGNIDAGDLNGQTELRTSGGNISISGFNGTVSAHTSGGDISTSDAHGQMDLRTSGGNVHLDGVSGHIEASTSGGSISANVQKVEGVLSLRTSGGDVHASVPAGQGYDIELDGNSVDTHLKNFSGTVKRDHVEGQIDGGGPRIVLHTSGGSVTLAQGS